MVSWPHANNEVTQVGDIYFIIVARRQELDMRKSMEELGHGTKLDGISF